MVLSAEYKIKGILPCSSIKFPTSVKKLSSSIFSVKTKLYVNEDNNSFASS